MYFFLAGETAVVLPSVCEQLQALNERVHTFAFDIVFIQIRQQLAQTPKLQVISSHSDIVLFVHSSLLAEVVSFPISLRVSVVVAFKAA